MRHGLRPGAGLACGAGCCGAGAELADVVRRAARPGMGAGERVEAEVAADFGDDIGDGTAGDVVVEVGAVHAVAQLGAQAVLQAGVQGGAAASVAAGALDHVLDLAEDAPAGSGAVLARVRGGRGRRGEAAGEHDATADGAGGAVEGGCDADEGVRDRGVRDRGVRDGGARDGGARRGERRGSLLRGLDLGGGLLV